MCISVLSKHTRYINWIYTKLLAVREGGGVCGGLGWNWGVDIGKLNVER